MNDIILILFFVQFLIYLGLTLFKTYNVMSMSLDKEKRNDYKNLKVVFISFIGLMFCYGIGFTTALSAASEEFIYIILFQLETWSLPFVALLFILELFFTFAKLSSEVAAAGSTLRIKS